MTGFAELLRGYFYQLRDEACVSWYRADQEEKDFWESMAKFARGRVQDEMRGNTCVQQFSAGNNVSIEEVLRTVSLVWDRKRTLEIRYKHALVIVQPGEDATIKLTAALGEQRDNIDKAAIQENEQSLPPTTAEDEEPDDTIVCPVCSAANGADRPVYHAPPACNPPVSVCKTVQEIQDQVQLLKAVHEIFEFRKSSPDAPGNGKFWYAYRRDNQCPPMGPFESEAGALEWAKETYKKSLQLLRGKDVAKEEKGKTFLRSDLGEMTNREVAAHIRAHVAEPRAPFSWITDGCGYNQHLRFVRHRNQHWNGATQEEWVAFCLAYADQLEREAAAKEMKERALADATSEKLRAQTLAVADTPVPSLSALQQSQGLDATHMRAALELALGKVRGQRSYCADNQWRIEMEKVCEEFLITYIVEQKEQLPKQMQIMKFASLEAVVDFMNMQGLTAADVLFDKTFQYVGISTLGLGREIETTYLLVYPGYPSIA